MAARQMAASQRCRVQGHGMLLADAAGEIKDCFCLLPCCCCCCVAEPSTARFGVCCRLPLIHIRVHFMLMLTIFSRSSSTSKTAPRRALSAAICGHLGLVPGEAGRRQVAAHTA